MADNNNTSTNTNWFKALARSGAGNSSIPPSGAGNPSKPPSLALRLPSFHNHHDLPTPPTTGPPSETPSSSSTPNSPSRRTGHHRHHRKSAGATLRSVSSFLNIKSATSKADRERSGSGSKPDRERSGSGTKPDRERSGSASTTASTMSSLPMPATTSAPLPVLVGPERRKLRGPTPVALLPLTEVDWDGFVGAGPGIVAAGEGEGVSEGTWHNPTLMQNVEMLGAAMARKGAGQSLDVKYVFFLFLFLFLL